MARVCEICGKGCMAGSSIIRRGMAKKKGGIGLHCTGISKRRFLPNLQKIRTIEAGNTVRRVVCAACIRSGKIVKA